MIYPIYYPWLALIFLNVVLWFTMIYYIFFYLNLPSPKVYPSSFPLIEFTRIYADTRYICHLHCVKILTWFTQISGYTLVYSAFSHIYWSSSTYQHLTWFDLIVLAFDLKIHHHLSKFASESDPVNTLSCLKDENLRIHVNISFIITFHWISIEFVM